MPSTSAQPPPQSAPSPSPSPRPSSSLRPSKPLRPKISSSYSRDTQATQNHASNTPRPLLPKIAGHLTPHGNNSTPATPNSTNTPSTRQSSSSMSSLSVSKANSYAPHAANASPSPSSPSSNDQNNNNNSNNNNPRKRLTRARPTVGSPASRSGPTLGSTTSSRASTPGNAPLKPRLADPSAISSRSRVSSGRSNLGVSSSSSSSPSVNGLGIANSSPGPTSTPNTNKRPPSSSSTRQPGRPSSVLSGFNNANATGQQHPSRYSHGHSSSTTTFTSLNAAAATPDDAIPPPHLRVGNSKSRSVLNGDVNSSHGNGNNNYNINTNTNANSSSTSRPASSTGTGSSGGSPGPSTGAASQFSRTDDARSGVNEEEVTYGQHQQYPSASSGNTVGRPSRLASTSTSSFFHADEAKSALSESASGSSNHEHPGPVNRPSKLSLALSSSSGFLRADGSVVAGDDEDDAGVEQENDVASPRVLTTRRRGTGSIVGSVAGGGGKDIPDNVSGVSIGSAGPGAGLGLGLARMPSHPSIHPIAHGPMHGHARSSSMDTGAGAQNPRNVRFHRGNSSSSVNLANGANNANASVGMVIPPSPLSPSAIALGTPLSPTLSNRTTGGHGHYLGHPHPPQAQHPGLGSPRSSLSRIPSNLSVEFGNKEEQEPQRPHQEKEKEKSRRDSLEPHDKEQASPTGNPHLDRMNELARQSRKQRKVLDLEISNNSLLAINRALERKLRKQNAEIRRFRRLSRAGGLSEITDKFKERRRRGEDGGEEEEYSEDESDDEDEEDELSDSNTESTTSRSHSHTSSTGDDNDHPDGPDKRDSSPSSSRAHKDAQRLMADLSRHQTLLISSQKLDDSIKRCLSRAETMLEEANKALEYRVGASDIRGGRVLSSDEVGDQFDGRGNKGLLHSMVPEVEDTETEGGTTGVGTEAETETEAETDIETDVSVLA